MKATYDKEADAMYIRVKEGKVHMTREISNTILADFDGLGNVRSIELLGISASEQV